VVNLQKARFRDDPDHREKDIAFFRENHREVRLKSWQVTTIHVLGDHARVTQTTSSTAKNPSSGKWEDVSGGQMVTCWIYESSAWFIDPICDIQWVDTAAISVPVSEADGRGDSTRRCAVRP
jgi:hypothetical protein